MPAVTTEQIFAALFALAQTTTGTDWSGAPIAIQYSSRNWLKVADVVEGTMPALYQLDPMPEHDVRTGLGRSRRVLHAQVDIRIQRQQSDQYPDVVDKINNKGPFSTLLNNWINNFYALFSPADGGAQTLSGLVIDCYPIKCSADWGNDQSRIAVLYFVMEIIQGG